MRDKNYNRFIYNTRCVDTEGQIDFNAIYWGELNYIKAELLKKYCVGKICLNAGCGSGGHTRLIPSAAVVNLDLSENMLKYCLKHLQSEGITNSAIVQADICDLPFKDDYFDVVFSFSCLYYVYNIKKALKELTRVLKQDGVAIFDLGNLLSMNTSLTCKASTGVKSYHITPWGMKEIIKHAGLRIVELRCFQLFPMWRDNLFGVKGTWQFVPLSGNRGKKLLSKKINGKMLDEILCSLPILKNFAFRYLFICRKLYDY